MKNTPAIVTLAACITALCRAASAAPVPENLLACRRLPDESQRVRCYDAQIDKMSGAVASGAAPAQAAPTAPAAAVARAPTVAPAAPAAAPRSASPALAAAAAAVQTAPPATAAASQSATFGQETLPPTSRPTTPKEDTALLSSITAKQSVGSNMYAFALANGQVWRQEESSQITLFFRVGDNVRIEKGTMGSYHMSTASAGAKNWVRVTRIQ